MILWCDEEVLTMFEFWVHTLLIFLTIFHEVVVVAALIWNEQPGFRNLYPFESCIFHSLIFSLLTSFLRF